MSNTINHQVILVSRPKGIPTEKDFAVRETQIKQPKDNEVLVRALYISVDPYLRKCMDEKDSTFEAFPLNGPPISGVVGEVVQSKSENFKPGDYVLGYLEWANYSVAKAEELQKIDPKLAPISTALGVLGMPGMTAYFGLLDIGKPKKGETVVISGAAGAVGTLTGQIAKIYGCRVIGIAGSDAKTTYLSKELRFDAAVNYRDTNYQDKIKEACPNGVDIYFDNVGGDITDQVLKLINRKARIIVCGQISIYNEAKPDLGQRPWWTLLVKSALAQGFVVGIDYADRYPEGIQQMAQWIKEGKIKYRESILEGIENLPTAFIGLFKGDNTGKQLVKVT